MIAIFLVFGGALLRLVPHLPNFTPIAAMALFSGAKLDKRYSLAVSLAAMAISDYLLIYINPYDTPMVNFSKFHPPIEMFHSTTLYVWTSILITGLLGILLKRTEKKRFIIGASLLSSVQFFLITNFGVWAAGYYGYSINALLESYIMGLPFFKWTILGDLFYTGFFFSTYNFAQRINHQLRIKPKL